MPPLKITWIYRMDRIYFKIPCILYIYVESIFIQPLVNRRLMTNSCVINRRPSCLQRSAIARCPIAATLGKPRPPAHWPTIKKLDNPGRVLLSQRIRCPSADHTIVLSQRNTPSPTVMRFTQDRNPAPLAGLAKSHARSKICV